MILLRIWYCNDGTRADQKNCVVLWIFSENVDYIYNRLVLLIFNKRRLFCSINRMNFQRFIMAFCIIFCNIYITH